jgi:phosphoglycolate phosphatase-like HAD superfamily hydrolase
LSLRALLFDLDGTLIDSERAICDAAAIAFGSVGVQVAELAVADHLGAPLEELYDLFVGDADRARLRRFVAAYIDAHDRHPEALPPPLPGVVDGLAAARRAFGGAKTSVATTKPSARATQQLAGAGLASFFDHVQGTDPGMKPKPAPDVVLAACRALGVDPGDAVMIGDTPRDVHAAKAAGAGAIVVAYTDARHELALGFGADHVVRSLVELPGLLGG